MYNSLRKEKDPRSPEREGIPSKIPVEETGVAVGGLCGRRGDGGREEGDGREEGTATPVEALRYLVASALLCRLFT